MMEIDHLNLKINGNYILNDICMSLNGGNIYGIVGDNGSGKTMLMRVIGGLVKPTSGIISFNQKSRLVEHPNIGIMIENTALYPDLTGIENLKLLAKIRGIISEHEIKNAINRVGLDPKDRRPFRKYSLGMKQRLMLAQAIMEKPDVLLLDEPTNAIDRDGVKIVHTVMREEANRGAIVLLASHIDKDIAQLCSSVAVMENGVLRKETGA